MAVSDTIRAFISLEVTKTIKEEIAKLQEKLRRSGADVKWIAPSSMHITLKFLGRVPSVLVPAIVESLEPVIRRGHRLQMSIEGLGVFPNLKNPRIVWIGLEGDKGLIQLQAGVEDAVSRLGFASEDRTFWPHLTVGRVKSKQRPRFLINAINSEQNFSAGKCELSELFLMKSDLKPDGVIHTPLWSMELPV